MEGLNLSDIVLDDMCYLYGKLPATKGYENAPAIGFIAHMDTVSDYCNHDITPVITENFNGVSLTLPAGITLSVHDFLILALLRVVHLSHQTEALYLVPMTKQVLLKYLL